MRIAVISDSHDNIRNIEEAVRIAGEEKADMLIHCGDICSPFVIGKLAAFGGPVHIVFGNNDGDRFTIASVAADYSNVTVHGESGEIETETGRIAFTHRPEFGRGLAATGDFEAVFSGHTHKKLSTLTGSSRHINPGELLGLFEEPGFIIYDSGTRGEKQFLL
ncbi:MAG TPA: YfcE family phosphodiesterase [Candidatus Krumholzibacterium sp.]|nr:YfcE family phosphodiesterase [Candidatus Krumholzibacterium sp.]